MHVAELQKALRVTFPANSKTEKAQKIRVVSLKQTRFTCTSLPVKTYRQNIVENYDYFNGLAVLYLTEL